MSKKTIVRVSGVYYFKWPGNDSDTRFKYFLKFDTDDNGKLCIDEESKKKHQELLLTLEANIETASERVLITSWYKGLIIVEIKEDEKESKSEVYHIDRLQHLEKFTNYAQNQLLQAEFWPDSNILRQNDKRLLRSFSDDKKKGVGHLRVSGVIAFTDGKGGIIDAQIGNNIEFEGRDSRNWYITPETLSSYHDLANQFNTYLQQAQGAELLNNHWYRGAMIIETNWHLSPDHGQGYQFDNICNLNDLKSFRNYVIEQLPWFPDIPYSNQKQSSLKQPLLLTLYQQKEFDAIKPETDEKQEGVLKLSVRKLRQCFSC